MQRTDVTRCIIALACACVALPGTSAHSQSTDHLLASRDYGRFEAALGRELVGDGYSGRVVGGYAAWRAIVEENSGWRVMGWSLWRNRKSQDANGQPIDVEHRAVIAGAGPELRLRLAPRRTWAVGFLGVGYARVYASHSEYYGAAQDFQNSSNAWALLGGIGITVDRVILQQHIVIIHGAMNTLQVNREYYPLMLGVRF